MNSWRPPFRDCPKGHTYKQSDELEMPSANVICKPNVSYVSVKSEDFYKPDRKADFCFSNRVSRLDDRRQLPHRPSMDSSGNDSEETDVTSGSTPNQNNLSLDQISTMTLDEFKSLLNNALSVPNGNTSEGSLESPRSQSSTESFKHTYTARSNKKPPLADATQKYRAWTATKSFDVGSSATRQDKILKSSSSADEFYELDRPARKISVARPKTPVSSVPRPKTPVSSVQRPKTPVSSVSRPKTPTSHIRSTTPVNVSRPKTPVNNTVSGSVPRPSPGVTRQSNGTSDISRPKTPTRFQCYKIDSDNSLHSKVEHRSSSLNRTYGEQSRSELRSSSLSRTSGENRYDSVLHNSGIKTLPSPKNTVPPDVSNCKSSTDKISDIRQRLAASRYGTDTNDSTVTSMPKVPSDLQFQKDSSYAVSSHVSPKPEQTSPNVSYVSITSQNVDEPTTKSETYFSKTYQAMRELSSGSHDTKAVTSLESDVSLSGRSESSFRSSSIEKSYGSSRQSSLSSVETSPKEEFKSVINELSAMNRTQSLDDSVITKTQKTQSTSGDDSIPSMVKTQGEKIPRPSTPVRPSTPSLIPRPCTPLCSLKDSISNLEKQPAYSGQNQTAGSGSGRPPTPRKASILAKSPSATNNTTKIAKNNNKDSSYTKVFLAKRSSTPGPATRTSTVTTPRRSRTPGPGERNGSSGKAAEPSEMSTKEISSSDFEDNITSQRTKTVPSSPAIQRRPRTPSNEYRSLSAQNSLEGETIITVNRSGGRHSLTVNDNKDTKSIIPTGARIIARAPSASQSSKPTTESDRSRSRARGMAGTERYRPRSVDPESSNAKKGDGNVLMVKRGENGAHYISNRTEAWVESAAKNTNAKTPNKSLPPKPVLRRCKTPNPRDIHEHELQSRPLEEIKAALSLPMNGLKEVDTTNLEAPPEDADMYAKMDELFRRLKQKELRASVNETPGGLGGHGDLSRNESTGQDDSDVASCEVCSLDSNENVKRKTSKSSVKSSPSASNRGSVPATPTRPKTPSLPQKDGGGTSTHQFTRANSMPPRPSTPTRSTPVSRRSSSNTSVQSAPTPDTSVKRSVSDHATMLVSKIKEILNTKPRKDEKSGPKSRIPAPKSLSAIGKSKSVSNLSSSNSENIAPNKQVSNGNLTKHYGDYDDEICAEISKYSSQSDLDYTGCNGTIRNGSETPVPKLATPLTTGRKEFLNNQRENTRTPKLVRAVSIGSLSSSSNTLSCNVGDDDDYV